MSIRVGIVGVLCLLGFFYTISEPLAQNVGAGRRTFEARCAACHRADGGGADMGPPIVSGLPSLDDRELVKLIREGRPARGMPPTVVTTAQMTNLVRFLRTMYVTARNECFALDAGSGRRIWHYKRPRTAGVAGGTANRGVGVAGDRVFMLTDHAHLIVLHRFTGELLWDAQLDDWRKNYAASSAPLPAGNVVISGVSGGEHGANGFVAAHDQETGKEVWRFWTVPKPGEPGSETWQGIDINHGGAPTWFTGSYDPELDIFYWPTGNSSKEYNGDDRRGDNLYASCLLALDRTTGKLKWYSQFIPHDLWDWDATQTSVLVDSAWQGQPRKLLLHANRNGFFLCLRPREWRVAPGQAVREEPDVGKRDRRRRASYQASQPGAVAGGHEGVPIPGRRHQLVLSFVQPRDWPLLRADIREVRRLHEASPGQVAKRPDVPWRLAPHRAGSKAAADSPRDRYSHGAITWELPQPGPGNSWGGTLATASGVVIVGEDGGGLMAVDAVAGKPLWLFQANQTWRASPMTYMFDNTQYVAVAAGSNIIAFAIQD